MEFEDEMGFGEDEGTAMGEKAKDRLKDNLLKAPRKNANYCKAIVTADCEENDSTFGKGARGISLKIEGVRETCKGCICTKEEYELLCANHNVSGTLEGTTVEILLSNGLIIAIR